MFGFVQIEMSLADPPGSSVVLAATDWVQGALLGTLATIIAVIAVAAIGFLMLLGRVDARRGATVLMGCFVLFGAPVIAAGLRGMASGTEIEYADLEVPIKRPLVIPPPASLPPQNTNAFDPYAGAAVQR
jgi:type IV secretory pathway VirB2 component (pilin)